MSQIPETPEHDAQTERIRQLTADVQALRAQVATLSSQLETTESGEPIDDFEYIPVSQRLRSLLPSRSSIPSSPPSGLKDRGVGAFNRWWDRGSAPAWEPPHPRIWDALALIAITVLGFLMRYINVANIPPGMHGDEAATGLAARQIMDEGWIGVYTGRAGGNPTGVYYMAVPFMKWIEDPVVAVRLLAVIGGTLAVTLLYILVRRSFGFGAAVVAGFALAIANWAIQFGRIGFVTVQWLPFGILGVICLIEAMRSQKWYWWIAAGITLPSAMYMYNGQTPMLLLLLPFAAVGLFGFRFALALVVFAAAIREPNAWTIIPAILAFVFGMTSPAIRRSGVWVNAVAFTAALSITANKILQFIRTYTDEYFDRSRTLSVFKTDDWKLQQSVSDKAEFLVRRYWAFWDQVVFNPRPNGADLSGITAQIPALMFYLFVAGVVLAIIRRPGWPTLICLALAFVMPLSSVLTDNASRRSVIIIAFVCVFIGIGIYELVRLAANRGRVPGVIAGLVCILLLAQVTWRNYDDFFNVTVPSESVASTFGVDYRDAMEYMAEMPESDYVIFFCGRWSLRYDTGLLIAPDVRGEDRLEQWGGTGGYEVDRALGDPVFVLMNGFQDRLPALQALYPGGTVVVGPTADYLNTPSYIAYYLPPEP